MTRLRCSPLALCAVLLLPTACLRERGKPQPGAAAAAAAARRAPATALPPVDPASTCAAAALTMKPGTVVGRIRGEDVKADDLGKELVAAEQQALRTYCKSVTEARQQAFDNHVHEKLLSELASADGKSLQEYLKSRVDAEVPTPDETEIVAFYEANKPDNAPALELVRDQVIAAINGQKTDAALSRIIEDVEQKNAVERTMPDISLPPVDLANPAYAPVLGPEGAAVQVVMFSDFECPYCARAAETLGKLKSKYAGASVQFVYRHFPLSFHPNAKPAAEYAQCAQAQGKFWPMHDAIFAAQSELSEAKLKEIAGQVGLDAEALAACTASDQPAREVEADMDKGREAGVEGTPSFYINGQAFAGNPTPEGIGRAIEAELAKARG